MRYKPAPTIDARNAWRGPAPTIDAHKAWRGDANECSRLYRQFKNYFHCNFYKIRQYYGWKKKAMLVALRSAKN